MASWTQYATGRSLSSAPDSATLAQIALEFFCQDPEEEDRIGQVDRGSPTDANDKAQQLKGPWGPVGLLASSVFKHSLDSWAHARANGVWLLCDDDVVGHPASLNFAPA